MLTMSMGISGWGQLADFCTGDAGYIVRGR
jgi:hypothetical protein